MQSILGWIAFAPRPLRKAELRSALSFSAEVEDVNVQELAPNYLFDMCAPLVEERSDSTFAFIHVSVKEWVVSRLPILRDRCLPNLRNRFLQSPESNVILDEFNAAHEQGLAIVSCLLSGLQIFQPTYPEQTRFLRVLQGFHGLHVYASEYWLDYILSIAASEKGLDTGSKFFARSHELSTALNLLHTSEDKVLDGKVLDDRLHHIESHIELWRAAGIILSERTTKTLDADQRSGNPPPLPPGDTHPVCCYPTNHHKSNQMVSARSQVYLHCYPIISTLLRPSSKCGGTPVSAFKNSKSSSKISALQPSLAGSGLAPSPAVDSGVKLFCKITNKPMLLAFPAGYKVATILRSALL